MLAGVASPASLGCRARCGGSRAAERVAGLSSGVWGHGRAGWEWRPREEEEEEERGVREGFAVLTRGGGYTPRDERLPCCAAEGKLAALPRRAHSLSLSLSPPPPSSFSSSSRAAEAVQAAQPRFCRRCAVPGPGPRRGDAAREVSRPRAAPAGAPRRGSPCREVSDPQTPRPTPSGQPCTKYTFRRIPRSILRSILRSAERGRAQRGSRSWSGGGTRGELREAQGLRGAARRGASPMACGEPKLPCPPFPAWSWGGEEAFPAPRRHWEHWKGKCARGSFPCLPHPRAESHLAHCGRAAFPPSCRPPCQPREGERGCAGVCGGRARAGEDAELPAAAAARSPRYPAPERHRAEFLFLPSSSLRAGTAKLEKGMVEAWR